MVGFVVFAVPTLPIDHTFRRRKPRQHYMMSRLPCRPCRRRRGAVGGRDVAGFFVRRVDFCEGLEYTFIGSNAVKRRFGRGLRGRFAFHVQQLTFAAFFCLHIAWQNRTIQLYCM